MTTLLAVGDKLMSDFYRDCLLSHSKIVQRYDAQSVVDYLDAGHNVDVLIVEAGTGYHNGIELLYEVRSHEDWIHVPVVLLSDEQVSRMDKDRWEQYGLTVLEKSTLSPPALRACLDRVSKQVKHDHEAVYNSLGRSASN